MLFYINKLMINCLIFLIHCVTCQDKYVVFVITYTVMYQKFITLLYNRRQFENLHLPSTLIDFLRAYVMIGIDKWND
jgi:hypothetical protein